MIEIDIDKKDLDEIIGDSVQFALVVSQNKLPIKRSAIIAECFRRHGKHFNAIFPLINKKLEDCFGFKLVKLPDNKLNQYILVNNLEASNVEYFEKSKEENIIWGLMMSVLAIIFMKQEMVHEEVIWEFFKTLGYEIKDLIPEINCSLKELVTQTWVKQQYLQYNKIQGSETVEHVFDWGFRAKIEVDKLELLKFVCTIYDGEVKPELWKDQYNKAVNIEEESDDQDE